MTDSRSEWVEREDGAVMHWPFCSIPGCPNRICLSKGETRFCWPHSSSGQSVGEIIAEAGVKEPAPST